jgi:hypothetical protein
MRIETVYTKTYIQLKIIVLYSYGTYLEFFLYSDSKT